MLNEIREYEQYTAPPESLTDKNECRLKYATLIKTQFSGLERAMTIVARRHLPLNPTEEDTAKVRRLLKVWCGFGKEDEAAECGVCYGWLKKYMVQMCRLHIWADVTDEETRAKFLGCLPQITLQGNKENWDAVQTQGEALKAVAKVPAEKIISTAKALATWEKRAAYLAQGLFAVQYTANKSDNDLHRICYDKIIANALELGPLKNYVLAAKLDPFKAGLIKKYTRFRNKGAAITKNTSQDTVLKFTAAYLRQRAETGREYAVINFADMSNWVNLQDPKFDNAKLSEYRLADGSTVFNFINVGPSVKKMSLAPDWLELFELAEANSIVPGADRGRIFYRDNGAGSCLEQFS